MIDNIEVLLGARQSGEIINEDESTYVKRIIKEIANTFPCEWDEALEELEIPKTP